jgi:Zn-dependent protease
MMNSGWRIGTIFGIPLQIHPSWLGIVALVTVANAIDWGVAYPNWTGALPWVTGLASALLLFASVLLHELGHSLTAQSQGIPVQSITLFLFGGVAAIGRESKTPGQAFQVAIAGPAVSLALAGLLGALTIGLGSLGQPSLEPIQVIAADLSRINLIMALFNLIPGLPLDGGQVFKAAVWKATGDRFKAVHWAARGGMVLGWMAMVGGLVASYFNEVGTGIWITLLGWFVVQNAQRYDQMTILQEGLSKITVAEAMGREFRILDGAMTLGQFADKSLGNGEWGVGSGATTSGTAIYIACRNGRDKGQVRLDDLQAIERSRWDLEALDSIAKPIEAKRTVVEATPIAVAIRRLDSENLERLVVVGPTGSIIGTLDRGDIVAALAKKLNLKLGDETIAQAKRDHRYPNGLQLGGLAESLDEGEELVVGADRPQT